MVNSLSRAAADDCTVLYSCDNCWTGSNNWASNNTNATTVPMVTSPRPTSQPPIPIANPVEKMPSASTSPKYQVDTRMLWTCDL